MIYQPLTYANQPRYMNKKRESIYPQFVVPELCSEIYQNYLSGLPSADNMVKVNLTHEDLNFSVEAVDEIIDYYNTLFV